MVIRAGMKRFGIPENHILATKVQLENGVITDRLACIPSGPGNLKFCSKSSRKGSMRPSAIPAGTPTCLRWPNIRSR